MKIKYRRFLAAAFAVGIISVFAASAQAQWTFVAARNDTAGHLIYFEEKNAVGDVRVERKEYFPGTHIVAHLQRRITKAKGPVVNMVEQRDRQNRIVFISNKNYNAVRVLVNGSQQRWRYNGLRDTRGVQQNERYDATTRSWKRFA